MDNCTMLNAMFYISCKCITLIVLNMLTWTERRDLQNAEQKQKGNQAQQIEAKLINTNV